MKKLILLILVFLSYCYLVPAQNDTLKRSGIYRAWISDGTLEREGILYRTGDSSLSLATSFSKKEFLSGKPHLINFKYNSIDVVKIRNINSFLNGIIAGSAVGLLAGAGIGYALGDDPHNTLFWLNAKDKALIGGIIGVLAGSALGAGLLSLKVTIPINRNLLNFNNNKKLLIKYSYVK